MYFFRNLFFDKRKNACGRYGALKIGLIADELTAASLEVECNVLNLTPRNYRAALHFWKPDLIFVESAWNGLKGSWKYQLAEYPTHPERNNKKLEELLLYARHLGIPAVFWNKEDGVHYQRFLRTARLFDNIFTVDINCVEKYRQDVPHCANVAPLMFPVQPRFHFLLPKNEPKRGFGCFVGSYSNHIHEKRRYWQDMLFETVAPYGLDIYDRNYKRKASHYRYPVRPGMHVHPGVPYSRTAGLYRSYKINLNVNTVENSCTMYSRRLIEILAVGGIAVSAPSMAVSHLFSEFCYVVNSRESIFACLEEVQHDSAYRMAIQRAQAGAQLIAERHTWENRLSEIEGFSIF